jgi:hypothetical protein
LLNTYKIYKPYNQQVILLGEGDDRMNSPKAYQNDADPELEKEARKKIGQARSDTNNLIFTTPSYFGDMDYGNVEVSLHVRLHTTTEELRKAIPIALNLRNWLQEKGCLALDRMEYVEGDQIEYHMQEFK